MNSSIAKLVALNWLLVNAFIGLAYFAPDTVDVDLGAALRIAKSNWTISEQVQIAEKRYDLVSAPMADQDLSREEPYTEDSLALARMGFIQPQRPAGSISEDWTPPRLRNASQDVAL